MAGIIYKISSDKGSKVYYGSTIQPLAKRISQHKRHMKCSSSMLFDEYGIDDCIAETVEEVSVDLLLERERYWIDNDKNSVNIRRPWVSEEEHKERLNESSREWYEKNKESHNQRSREWREQNKEYNKEYYEQNKDKIKAYSRLYRLKRKASVEILSL